MSDFVDWSKRQAEAGLEHLENAGSWLKNDSVDWFKDGGYNFPIAASFALVAGLFTQATVSSWFGGGLFGNSIALLFSATVAMASAVLGVKGFNGLKDMIWKDNAIQNGGSSPEKDRSQAPQQQREQDGAATDRTKEARRGQKGRRTAAGQSPGQRAGEEAPDAMIAAEKRGEIQPPVEQEYLRQAREAGRDVAEAPMCLPHYVNDGAESIHGFMPNAKVHQSLKKGSACIPQ